MSEPQRYTQTLKTPVSRWGVPGETGKGTQTAPAGTGALRRGGGFRGGMIYDGALAVGRSSGGAVL
jgi:hypothetical protein